MPPIHVLIAAAALLMAPPLAHAQERTPSDGPPRRVAIPRAQAPARQPEPVRQPEPARQPEPERSARPAPQPRSQPVAAAPVAAPAADQRRAEPRGSRPRGDNPRTGVAVPRGSQRAGRPPRVVRPAPRVVRPAPRISRRAPRIYNNYYYYPRRYHPYGYGGFGLGYFYYNPYSWYGHGHYGSVYGAGGVYGRGYGYDTGELRLRVSPRHAEVYVDGYYAGVVDDYDGILQALRLESGPYRIELVAPGYEPLDFSVRITPGHKITYRGELRRLP